MALSFPVPHGAPLRPARDWSCPNHAWPWEGDDDDRDDVGCLGCRYGKWVDRLDENGEPVIEPVVTLFLPVFQETIDWLEDEFGDG